MQIHSYRIILPSVCPFVAVFSIKSGMIRESISLYFFFIFYYNDAKGKHSHATDVFTNTQNGKCLQISKYAY